MRVSREQVAENRQKILDAASRMFRARGFDGVSVVEVMNAAGLTHGGFYGYFKSKDDLVAQALGHVVSQAAAGDHDILRYADRYLSPAHRDDLAGGCPIAALGAETARQTPEARAIVTAGLREQITRFSEQMPGIDAETARKTVIGNWAAMVGAVILARVIADPALSDEVLERTHEWITDAMQQVTQAR